MIDQIDDRAYLEPPDYEADAILKCYWCEGGIFEDEAYFEIENKNYCEECLNDNFKKYAERQDFWEE